MKHNNVVPNVHLHKDWKNRVKTWFNQPGRKQTRRRQRAEKAAAVFPRPLNKLRPVVRAPTIRYNSKLRFGKGFTFAEIKEAGLTPTFAKTIGITVDHRRTNASEESLRLNVQRLNEYKNKLVLFPRNAAKPKKLDSSPEEIAQASQYRGIVLPIKAPRKKSESRAITEDEKKKSVFRYQRVTRGNVRMAGIRKKKAAEAAAK